MAVHRAWSIRSVERLLVSALGLMGLLAAGIGVTSAGTGEPPARSAKGVSCSGAWSGEYRYPDGQGQRPVPFTALIVQRGDSLLGEITEINTFGDKEQPWLHATLIGKIEPKSGNIEFTKTYDGTGGQTGVVVYKAQLLENATTMGEGTWNLGGNLEGTFSLRKKSRLDEKPRKDLADLTGLWKGKYEYSSPSQKPVEFVLVLVPDGDYLSGEITEANTFGNADNAPWLHARVEAKIDPETRVLRFLKTYDGTGKVNHDVRYEGKLSADGEAVKEGTWKIGENTSGTFSLQKETD